MPTEFEAKVLDIDPDRIARSILERGGDATGESFMRRYVYDIDSSDQSTWIRLRDTGNVVTLTVKEIKHDGIDGTDEVEVGVDDFETTNELLGRLGYRPKSYQENRRVSFVLNGARLELDSWPMIPTYLEIEADDHDGVLRAASLLGIDASRLTGENTTAVYARYGIDLAAIQDLRFDGDPPA